MASIWLTAKHAWLLLVDTNFPRLYTVQCTRYSLPIGLLTGLWISYWSKNCENFLGGNLRERERRDAVWNRRTDARRESISGTHAQLWESVQPSRWSANRPVLTSYWFITNFSRLYIEYSLPIGQLTGLCWPPIGWFFSVLVWTLVLPSTRHVTWGHAFLQHWWDGQTHSL